MGLLLLGGWVSDGLVDREDGASGFTCGGQDVEAHDLWLPDEDLVHVVDFAVEDVNSLPHAFFWGLSVDLSQFIQNVGCVHA